MDERWTVGEVLRVSEDLARKSPGRPGRAALSLCLADVLGVDRLSLLLQHERPLSPDERGLFRSRLGRLLGGEPLAYVLGWQEFWGRRFAVGPDVLIPRPETELLVERALAVLPEGARVFEPCTGSGCVAISLALERPDLAVVASDVSAAALAVARANAARLGATAVDWREGSSWAPVEGEVFDALCANPPYVDPTRPELLDEAVRRFEPAAALFASGEDPLGAYRALLAGVDRGLVPGGQVLLELGVDTATRVRELAEAGGVVDVEVWPDLGGRPRLLVGRRPG